MKAKIEFDLSDEDDKYRHDRMLKAVDMHLALIDIADFIRSKVKYTEEESISLDELNGMFWHILSDRGIDLLD